MSRKMNKFLIFLGLVLSFFILADIRTGSLTANDVFQAISKGPEVAEKNAEKYFKAANLSKSFYEKIFKKLEEGEEFEDEIRGAVLTADVGFSKEIAQFFLDLKATQEVKTFVVIGENHKRLGPATILISKYGFETDFGKIEPDFKILDQLKYKTSYNAFSNENSISFFAPFIKKYFPQARIVPILIKDSASNMEDLAAVLSAKLGDDTVVIASSAFSQNMTENVAAFHDELAKDVLENFDVDAVAQLDIDSQPVLIALMKYLEKKEAKKVEIINDATAGKIAVFYEGKPIKEDRNLTVMAFGDLMLGRYVRKLMDDNGHDYIFEKIKGYEGRFFKGADVVFGNLEGPIKGEGYKSVTGMVFGFNEDIAPFLKKSGFNLFSISNNHAVDQGWDGVKTTIEALEGSDLGWCGHPSEADANSVYYGKAGKKKFAFICLQDITYKLNDEEALNLIKNVRPNVDFLLVSVHWGIEYKHSPNFGLQISPGRAFVDAGADFVIGHHPHVVESFEAYNGKLIFYSLGNFVFDQYWSKETQEEMGIGIVMDDDDEDEAFKTKVYLYPMKSEASQSRLMSIDESLNWIEKFINYGEYSEDMKEQIRKGVIEIKN